MDLKLILKIKVAALDKVNEIIYTLWKTRAIFKICVKHLVQLGKERNFKLCKYHFVVRNQCFIIEVKSGVNKIVLLPTLLYNTKNWVSQEKCENKLNTIRKVRSLCSKRSRMNNKWMGIGYKH